MEQVYTPNILVKARPGYCLGYVDDAGDAPARTANAKIAYTNEVNAGRINLSELPDNVWVSIFLSFSKGGYWYGDTYLYFKDLGHVALAKRTGNTMVIYDSEVQSGIRKPYPAIAAVEAWFSAYGAKYIGWSTHCDGREYAKLKENDMVSEKGVDYLFRVLLGRSADPKQKLEFTKSFTFDALEDWIRNLPEFKDKVSLANKGEYDLNNLIVYPYSQYTTNTPQKLVPVTEQLYRKG